MNRKFGPILPLSLCFSVPAMAATCESLAALKLADTTITLAQPVKVVKSLEPSLDANAMEAVKTWKFAPATKDGRPVAVTMRLDVDFKLR